MSILTKLDDLFDSKTITPLYSLPQVLCSLFEFYSSPTGIGRYQLKTRVGLGEGSLRTLLKRLEQSGFISVKGKRLGHTLSEKGHQFMSELLKRFSLPILLESPPNWLILLGVHIYFSIVRSEYVKKAPTMGIEQRDAAMIHGGKGAVCMIFNGKEFMFPNDRFVGSDLSIIPLDSLKINDIVCFAGSDDLCKSRLALIAAILTLL